MITTFEDIFVQAEAIECPPKARLALKGLQRAMSDWPDDFDIVEEFLFAVESFLGVALNAKSVRNQMHTLDLASDAWRAESLAELLVFLDEFGCASALECTCLLREM